MRYRAVLKRLWFSGLLLLSLNLSGCTFFNQGLNNDDHVSRIAVGLFNYDPLHEEISFPSDLQSPRKNSVYIIQYEQGSGEQVYDDLVAHGGTFLRYLRQNAFLFKIDVNEESTIQEISNIRFIGHYHPVFKLSGELYSKHSESRDLSQTIELNLALFPEFNTSEATLMDIINGLSGYIIHFTSDFARIAIPHNKIADVAKLDFVRAVEVRDEIVCEMDVAAQISRAPTTRASLLLSGHEQILSIIDTGLDNAQSCTGAVECMSRNPNLHPDLMPRSGNPSRLVGAFNYNQPANSVSDTHGHGTHVAGIAVGNGIISKQHSINPAITGIAPRAQFVAIKTGNGQYQQNFKTYLEKASSMTATIHNLSCGNPNNTSTYQTQDDQVDTFLVGKTDQVVVKSAGNRGIGASGTVLSTITSPGSAKNSITVANSENIKPQAYNGSIPGPYADNPSHLHFSSSAGPSNVSANGQKRLKPDLTAPGTIIASLQSSAAPTPTPPSSPYTPSFPYPNQSVSSRYVYMTGTSMAAPYVSGMAALIRQYIYKKNIPVTPPGALIKAFLINGAVDMQGVAGDFRCQNFAGPPQGACPNRISKYIPSNDQGWGRVNLEKSLKPCGDNMCLFYDGLGINRNSQNTILDSQIKSKTYKLRFSRAVPINITLTWYDEQGEVLLNDLDLKLRPPLMRNTTYYGGVPSFTPDGATESDGVSHPNRDPDRVNTVEKLVLKEPPADGFYRVSVIGTTLQPNSKPSFALVASGISGADSADALGRYSYFFEEGEQVNLNVVGVPKFNMGHAYVIKHDPNLNFLGTTPINLQGLDVRGNFSIIAADSDGVVHNGALWNQGSSVVGQYNIVIDVDKDHSYTKGIDIVDYATKPGFTVYPSRKRRAKVSTGGLVPAKRFKQNSYIDISGTNFPESASMSAYIIPSTSASNLNGASLTHLAVPFKDNPKQITSLHDGDLPFTPILASPPTSILKDYGLRYNVVIDVDNDGIFTIETDAIDQIDISAIAPYVDENQSLQVGSEGQAVSQVVEFLTAWYGPFYKKDPHIFGSGIEKALLAFTGQTSIEKDSSLYAAIADLADIGFVIQPNDSDTELTAIDSQVGIYDILSLEKAFLTPGKAYWGWADSINLFGAECDSPTFLNLKGSNTITVGGLFGLSECLLTLSKVQDIISERSDSESSGITILSDTEIKVQKGSNFRITINK